MSVAPQSKILLAFLSEPCPFQIRPVELGEENLILAGFDIKLWPLEAVSRLFMGMMKCPTLKKVGKVSADGPTPGHVYRLISTLVK